MDTETLFALVASQLPEKDLSFTQDTIMDALLTSNGNVDAAVRYLLDTRITKTKKRKHINLDTWLRSSSRSKQVKSKLEGPGPSSTMTVSSSNHIQQSTSSALNSNSEETVNLLSVLRQPPSLKKEPSRLPPMLLSNPQMVAKHTPCTMHLGVLPPELACRLFHTMINASKNWKRNKWWLFDRVVESPHLTSFFARKTDGLDGDENWQEAAQYWYNGRMTEPPEPFSPEMEEACKIIEHVVNEEMKNRKRFTLEWAGKDGADPLWRANVAASNCYQGGRESVGFHSDQVTYLGPYPTIASLSLGTRRNFRLREVIPNDQLNSRKAQTFNIPLAHNSLIIMHASCQERFKHSIPPQSAVDLFRPQYSSTGQSLCDAPIEPSNCRINITFRFYRPDFRPYSIPHCKCGIPTVLRPDMKNRSNEEKERYWWTCYAGAQNDGKGCDFWKVMNMQEEGRGPWFHAPRSSGS